MLRWTTHVLLAACVLFIAAVPVSALAQEATPAVLDPAVFSPVVTNPYFPLASVGFKVLEGDFVDEETGETVHERVEERVLPETVVVAGIEVAVVEVNEYADGELTEHTLDYYAQHEDGTVSYLGEDVDMIEDGDVVSHEGAWCAGEGDNLPGVFMPSAPQVGDTFAQERAPGLAEDRSTVIAIGEEVTVAAGSFAGCIRTEDVNPLDGATEFKLYCPGVGIVREESDDGALELIAFAGGLPLELEDEATPED
jgi:hypothetical protein